MTVDSPPRNETERGLQTPVELALALRDLNEKLLISSVREHGLAEDAELKRSQLTALLEALSEGVVIAEPSGRLLVLNRAACAFLGTDPSVAPRTMRDLLRYDMLRLDKSPMPAAERPVTAALQGESFVDRELLIVNPDGTERRLLASATSIMESDGKTVALAIVVLRDVTAVRRLEQEREEYLALISHDLRGPLSAITLLAHSLNRTATEDGLSATVLDRVARIERNAARMTTMITELLEATSLETRPALRRDVCPLRDIVRGAIERLDDASRERIAFEIVSDACCVVADPAPLDRAITNLVTNAIKYSEGPVCVRLERRGDEAILRVIDQGVGIAPESVGRVFDRYYRAATGTTTPGLGLGLYITRLIAEAHGGRVEVLSELGHGSTFSLVLPLHTPTVE